MWQVVQMLRQELGYLSSPFGVPFQGDDGFFASLADYGVSEERCPIYDAAAGGESKARPLGFAKQHSCYRSSPAADVIPGQF